MDVVKTVVIVLVVIVAILVGFCCHFASLKRREEELAARRTAQHQAVLPPAGNENQNDASPVYIFRLQGATGSSNSAVTAREQSNPVEDPGVPEGSPQSPDPIADSGPPSYSCLAAPEEPPPPSYEEAVRASTENLAVERLAREHFV